MNWAYSYFFVPIALFLLKIAALFSEKLKLFIDVRVGLLERWRKADLGKNPIWFHVSSVGELEQIRPVLEMLSKQNEFSLVLSYYSISVPRLVKDWSFVRYADYLPLDSLAEMHELMAIIHPRLLVLNRYDLWPNHLRAAQHLNVPIALVNASTPPLGFFGYWSLRVRRTLFWRIDFWTYVDSNAASAWEPFVRRDVKGLVAGNPRVDRALERVKPSEKQALLREKILGWEKKQLIVAGSTWKEDELLLLNSFSILQKKFPNLGLLLVPHEPEESHLKDLEKLCSDRGIDSARFSSLRAGAAVHIVDARGYLAELYALARVAYVGGGFGREVHSVIEPLAHGLPVAFGPHHHRSPEAETLLAMKSAFVACERGAPELAEWLETMLLDSEASARARESLRVYLGIHRGAGQRIGDFLLGCLRN